MKISGSIIFCWPQLNEIKLHSLFCVSAIWIKAGLIEAYTNFIPLMTSNIFSELRRLSERKIENTTHLNNFFCFLSVDKEMNILLDEKRVKLSRDGECNSKNWMRGRESQTTAVVKSEANNWNWLQKDQMKGRKD